MRLTVIVFSATYIAYVNALRFPVLKQNARSKTDYLQNPSTTAKPNIFFFLADDLGRADVSFAQGNLQTPTPNIDKFAWDGIVLNRAYVNPICTPTRAALLTGKYTFHVGMQTSAIGGGEPWGLPLDYQIMPQYFKKVGYTSYHIGKWHLGSFKRAYFPVNRGFDDSFGVLGGGCNWFNYTESWIIPVAHEGHVFRINGKSVPTNHTMNHYAPDLWTSRAEQIIHRSDPSKPWMIHFWTTAPHASSGLYDAVQFTMPEFQLRPVVMSFTDQFPERKKQLAVIQMLDDSFKRIIDALTNKGVINNTILIFFSDNGAALPRDGPLIHGSNYGSNFPLRHGKGTLFEGGVRTPAFIWSPLIRRRGRIANQLFHVADWLPTLYEAVGGNPADLISQNLDGVSHWQHFQAGSSRGPRTELVTNIDANDQYAMVYQNADGILYKIIGGNILLNDFTGWGVTEGTTLDKPMRTWTPASITCNSPEGVEVTPCFPWVADCLFDLLNDPCETNNIAARFPEMLKLLRNKITVYNATSVKSGKVKTFDPASLLNGVFVPWLDPDEVLDKEPLTYAPFNRASSF